MTSTPVAAISRASSLRISANAQRQLFAAPVVGVVQRVDHGHRAGQRELDRLLGRAAQEARRPRRRPGARARDRTDDHRHVGVVAVADAHGPPVLEIDAVEVLDEGGDEVAARLLAVGDDVDAGALLVAQHQAHGIALALGERLALEQPRRPELFGRASQAGFGRLPAIVVCRERFIGVLGGGGRARRVVDHDYIGALPGAGGLWRCAQGTARRAISRPLDLDRLRGLTAAAAGAYGWWFSHWRRSFPRPKTP